MKCTYHRIHQNGRIEDCSFSATRFYLASNDEVRDMWGDQSMCERHIIYQPNHFWYEVNENDFIVNHIMES